MENEKPPPAPAGFLWRRYNQGEPVWLLPELRGWVLYPVTDAGQFPGIPRWAGMGDAFLGFAGYRDGGASAAVYDLGRLMTIVSREGLVRQHDSVGDILAVADYIRYNLCGVWMGAGTPFAFTPEQSFESAFGGTLVS
jgi:hypothetical protein